MSDDDGDRPTETWASKASARLDWEDHLSSSRDRIEAMVDDLNERFLTHYAERAGLTTSRPRLIEAARRILKERAVRDEVSIEQRRRELTRTLATTEERLRRLEAELAQLDGLPSEDPYPNGTVLIFQTATGLAYAAIRVNGLWYCTGQGGSPQRANWQQFVSWTIAHGATEFALVQPVEVAALGQHDVAQPWHVMATHHCGDINDPHGDHVWRMASRSNIVYCPGS